jgi:hypothetical protein
MVDIKTTYSYSENMFLTCMEMYGSNKLEGNQEGNFNILGRKMEILV